MRNLASRSAAVLLVAALLAQVFGAGAVLADDLRDMFAGNTGLADNPETPGPDLYPPIVWGDDIPDMPSLVDLDAPEAPALPPEPHAAETVVSALNDHAPCPPRPREISARGPPTPLS